MTDTICFVSCTRAVLDFGCECGVAIAVTTSNNRGWGCNKGIRIRPFFEKLSSLSTRRSAVLTSVLRDIDKTNLPPRHSPESAPYLQPSHQTNCLVLYFSPTRFISRVFLPWRQMSSWRSLITTRTLFLSWFVRRSCMFTNAFNIHLDVEIEFTCNRFEGRHSRDGNRLSTSDAVRYRGTQG